MRRFVLIFTVYPGLTARLAGKTGSMIYMLIAGSYVNRIAKHSPINTHIYTNVILNFECITIFGVITLMISS